MGAQWKHAGKMEGAAKRSQIVGKLTKEIQVAARLGDPNPDHNARLRAAVEAARKHSVPKDTIDRAIKKGAGIGDEAVIYETLTFEGFAPHKIPIIVECLTENKNRTSADIRVIFRKGHLGSIGNVTWMFDRLGVVEASHPNKTLDLETVAIEAGAQNVEPLEGEGVPEGHLGARFICDTGDLDSANKWLSANGWSVTATELSYIAKNFPELSAEQRKEVSEFLSELDDNDDVHRIHVALK